jgi:hypothetical protein
VDTIACNRGIETAHDHVVHLVAERFADAGRFVVETGLGAGRKGHRQRVAFDPDVAGWTLTGDHDRLEWVVEVETEETVAEAQAALRWRNTASLSVPFYLVVPKGHKIAAQAAAFRAGVSPRSILEYTLGSGLFELL